MIPKRYRFVTGPGFCYDKIGLDYYKDSRHETSVRMCVSCGQRFVCGGGQDVCEGGQGVGAGGCTGGLAATLSP